MLVGVPKEIKPQEYRVGLVPASTREFVSQGHEVYVETGAGAGIGASDDDYVQAGATIVGSRDDVFSKCEMIVKVKEPQPSEWSLLRENQILYTYLHLAPDPDQIDGLCQSGCAAFAYETVLGKTGGLPLLAPMSEVAGRLSIQAAADAISKRRDGIGLLLGGVPGVDPARVMIIGGGIVGMNAARMAIGLGADVTVLDRSVERLRYLDDIFKSRLKTVFSTREAIEENLKKSDVVIGSVLIPGANAPKLVTREMLKLVQPGTVLVDVAIDQGGCFETSKPTTHSDPTYLVDDVIHYCVANMPGIVPKTSSYALNNATLDLGLLIAREGWRKASQDQRLSGGLNIALGEIIHPTISESVLKSNQVTM